MNKLPPRLVDHDAVISDCENYRYWLKRTIRTDITKPIVFIMLNPSFADATINDPTITRCIQFVRDWGGSELGVVNLFALRSTDPRSLNCDDTVDPIGPLNDEAIQIAVGYALCNNGIVVVAWGDKFCNIMDRSEQVLGQLGGLPIFCLKKNKSGSPAHPLYQKKDSVLKLYKKEFEVLR